MDKRIVLESRGKEPSQVTELELDNARTCGEFEGLTEEFTALERLSAIQTGLTTLKGFPKLKSLKKCDLSENRLSGGFGALKECRNLVHLNLASNKIKSLEALEPLKSLENLEHLEVAFNEIYPDVNAPEAADQRQKIFEILPNLKWVDNYDQQGNELQDDDDDDDDDVVPNGVTERLSDAGEDDEEDEDGDDEDGEEEEYSSDDEDGPGLSALYGDPSNINDEDDGDYDEEEDEEGDSPVEEEEEDDDEAEPEHPVRGKKRKLDDGEGTT